MSVDLKVFIISLVLRIGAPCDVRCQRGESAALRELVGAFLWGGRGGRRL